MATTLFFVFVLAASAAARPANNGSYEPLERNGLIDQNSAYILDDMLLVDELPEQDKAATILDPRKFWPGGIVPYVIDYSVAPYTTLILDAMNEYNLKTCVKFIPRLPLVHKNYIQLTRGENGCSSYVGMVGLGLQPVNLGDGCMFRGTVVHELGHALGFIHEHMRSDRDQYLTIYWQNIAIGLEGQFQKWPANNEMKSTNYDFNGIMHYGNYAFSKDRSSPTMVAKNGQRLYEPYEKQGLTRTDAQMVNKSECFSICSSQVVDGRMLIMSFKELVAVA